MPTTIPLVSRHMNTGFLQDDSATTSNLDFVVVVTFAITGVLLSLAFASLFPISADVVTLVGSVS